MKIAGRVIAGKNRKTVVIPREDQEPIVFIAEAISDFDELNQYMVYPEPPIVVGKGGEKLKNHKDPGFEQQVLNYNIKRMAWIVLKSLEPSNIEWQTVDMQDPKTWTNYSKELREAGFSIIEINLICDAVLEANALDEDKLEAARQVFLRGQAGAKSTSGPNTSQGNSQSGKPVEESESDHRD